jgi:hypothetical protein
VCRWVAGEIPSAYGTLTRVDIKAQVRQFEKDMSAGRHDSDYYVQRMRNSNDASLRYLLAERLPRLGASVVPALDRLIEDPSAPKDARILAALVALQLGDRGACIGVLLTEVQADSEMSIPAANALARAKVAKATPLVAELLERTDPGDSASLLNVSSALKELGGRPSAGARERVARGAAAWVREAFERDFA